MKINIILPFIALFLTACQPAPTTAPELPATVIPQETATTAPTTIPSSPTPPATSTPETIKTS
ncbi:MAG: hypothetical protein Q8O48_12745, partial [Anaerolineales bacterium]|nr:hypothetical protein [Anaerolineales bacterium]